MFMPLIWAYPPNGMGASWNTVPVFFDFHGEPHGAAKDVFTSYGTGTSPRETGPFEAPFDGDEEA